MPLPNDEARPAKLTASLLWPGSVDRLRAAIGAVAGIALTAFICTRFGGDASVGPLLVAPMGASAVLLFAVPASPLAQPWPLLGGNILSALVGVTMVKLVPDVMVAGALAVGIAIGAMSLLRCLHPPGGAVALTTVLAATHGPAPGYLFALTPVGINSVLLLATGYLFHRFSTHSYPHRPHPAPAAHPVPPPPVELEDIEAAMLDYGEPLDVDPGDLAALYKAAELHAVRRMRETAGDRR